MTKHKKKNNPTKAIWLTFFGLIALGLVVAVLLNGADVALVNPKGLIAGQQLRLLLFSIALLLLIAVPTLVLFYFIAWKYRESNHTATYEPHARHGKLFVFGIWAIPTFYMFLLALVMWPATHKLAPQKSLVSDVKPLTIQVVALRWKWLFIYPEQNIATVNFVQIPADTPVQFELTADEAPMSSFWIPHLGGQLYAMTGHRNSLNLMAETTGDFAGRSAEINGDGFAGMKFVARASSREDFNDWAKSIRRSPVVLASEEYAKLLAPSENNHVAVYSEVEVGLYDTILAKYMGSHDHYVEQE